MKCIEKKAYLKMADANRAVRGRERDGVTGLRVYQCPECGCLHLTSSPPPVMKTQQAGGGWTRK
jgi:hypothetical protein